MLLPAAAAAAAARRAPCRQLCHKSQVIPSLLAYWASFIAGPGPVDCVTDSLLLRAAAMVAVQSECTVMVWGPTIRVHQGPAVRAGGRTVGHGVSAVWGMLG